MFILIDFDGSKLFYFRQMTKQRPWNLVTAAAWYAWSVPRYHCPTSRGQSKSHSWSSFYLKCTKSGKMSVNCGIKDWDCNFLGSLIIAVVLNKKMYIYKYCKDVLNVVCVMLRFELLPNGARLIDEEQHETYTFSDIRQLIELPNT